MKLGVWIGAGVMALLLGAAGALAGGPGLPQPPASAGPEAYVRWIYGHYKPNSDFKAETAYAPGLRALFKMNARLLGPDNVGENDDDDEFCQCQDFETLRVTRLQTAADGPRRATAHVSFANLDANDSVTLKLVLTPAGWRVDDVMHPRPKASPSLRARLVDENRRLKAGARPAP